ncbi:MAG: GNAT family N-acetyltransferase [Nocardioidaceae bacterium]
MHWTDDLDAVKALLADANPRHHGRPGDPDLRGWAAMRDDRDALLCVGALADIDTGVPHLRSITTTPKARGQGLAAAVSAFLTREALRASPPAVTLGLYSDNATARRLYTRLSYQFSHALLSGPLIRPAVQT